MLDLNRVNKRSEAIRKQIGVERRSFRDYTDLYSLYSNPGTGRFTGIMDNERQVFYGFDKPEDIIKFVGIINRKEEHFTRFMQGLEQELRKYVDREIEHFDSIIKLESENRELKEKLKNNNNVNVVI